DGVLRGHNEEWFLQRVLLARYSDLPLLHSFEKGRLRLRRGAVDLVGQDEVGEDGAGLELETPRPGGVIIDDDVAAGDIRGHEVGGELDAAELHVEHIRQRPDEHGLAQPGYAFEEHVAACQDADEDAVDHFTLAHNDAADL